MGNFYTNTSCYAVNKLNELQVRELVKLGPKALFLWDEADTVFTKGSYKYNDLQHEHISTLLLTKF